MLVSRRWDEIASDVYSIAHFTNWDAYTLSEGQTKAKQGG